jgi:N-acetyl-alpha-D-glucosaminyl L-malate synthase BshA
VIPNFVDTELYHPDGASAYAKTLCPEDEIVVMHVSNFRPVKRIEDVLAIFDRIRREVPARLLLVGDGPERSLAERLAAELEIEDRTLFLGNVVAVETILPIARVFLLPSDSESFGLAALEAMACGVPVVGTAAGGLPEVVVDGETGYLRTVGDVEGMARAALDLIRDRERWVRFSTAARRRAVEEFPTDGIVARYRAVYQRTLEKP